MLAHLFFADAIASAKIVSNHPENQAVNIGDTLRLNCTWEPTTVPLDSVKFRWILYGEDERDRFLGDSQVITVRNVTKADEGEYHCTVRIGMNHVFS